MAQRQAGRATEVREAKRLTQESLKTLRDNFLLTGRQSSGADSGFELQPHPFQPEPQHLPLRNGMNPAHLRIKREGRPPSEEMTAVLYVSILLEEQVSLGLAPGCAEEGILVLQCSHRDL